MGYNCCFFLNFVPLHIESPYNFGGTGPILGVKNPLQRVNGHAKNIKEYKKNAGLFGTLFTLATFGKCSTLNVVYSSPPSCKTTPSVLS
jgi:hypothetical protein